MKTITTKLLNAFRAVVTAVSRWRNRKNRFAAQTTTREDANIGVTYDSIMKAMSELPPTPIGDRITHIVTGSELMMSLEKLATRCNTGMEMAPHRLMGIEIYERPELFPMGSEFLGAIYYDNKPITLIQRRKATQE